MVFGIIYILFGGIFTAIAAHSFQNSGWVFLTIVSVTIAIINFGVGLRHIQRHRLNKEKK